MTVERSAPVAAATDALAWRYGSDRAVRTAGRDYVRVLGGQVAFAIVAAATLVVMARLLGPDGYGAVALFSALVQFCFVVCVKWLFPSFVRYGREALIRTGRAGAVFWPWAAAVVLATGAVLTAGVMLASEVARFTGVAGRTGEIFLLVLSQTALSAAAVQVLQMQGSQPPAAWLPVVGRVALLGALVVAATVPWAPRTPAAVLVCSGVALAAQFAASLPWISPDVVQPFAIGRLEIVRVAGYSSSLLLAYVGVYASDWIDLMFLRTFRSRTEIGQYQLAYQAMLFAASGLVALNTLAFPLLSAWHAERREAAVVRYVVRLVPQLSLLWLFVVLALGAVAVPAFAWAFGEGFARSGTIFSILLAAASFQAIDYLYGPLFLSHDMPGRATLSVVLTAAVNVAGDWLLVPHLGVMGAAIATAVSFAFAAWVKMRWGNERVGAGSTVAFRAAFAVALVVLAMAAAGSWSRLPIAAATGIVLIAFARRHGTFALADLELVGAVSLPPPLWRLARWTYAHLAPRVPVTCP